MEQYNDRSTRVTLDMGGCKLVSEKLVIWVSGGDVQRQSNCLVCVTKNAGTRYIITVYNHLLMF